MTIERHITISARDIVSVGFLCSHCGSLYSVPVDKLDRALPTGCSNCQEPLAAQAKAAGEDYADAEAVAILLDFLRLIRKKPVCEKLRFGITGDINDLR
jgi:uncharacterized paraquat-inducible protein A